MGKVEGEHKKDEKTFEKWLEQDSPEGVESRINFERRIVLVFQKLIELDNDVLIVAHGGAYDVLSFYRVACS